MKISTRSLNITGRVVPSRFGLITLAGALTLFSGSAAAQFHVNSKDKTPYPKDKISKIAKEVRSDGWIFFKETLKEKPQELASKYKESLGLGPADELRVTEASADELGITRYRYTQYHGSWPVEGADFSIYGKAEKPLFASGRLVQTLLAPQVPALTEAKALATALSSVPAKRYQWQDLRQEQDLRTYKRDSSATNYPKGKVLYALTSEDGNAEGAVHRLAYRFEIMRVDPVAYEAVYIDALTGKLLRISSLVSHGSCQNNQVDTWYNGNRHVGTWWDSNSNNFKLQDFCRGGYIYTKYSDGSSDDLPGEFSSGYFITASGSEFNALNSNWNWDFKAKSAASAHYAVQAAHYFFKTEFGRNGPSNSNRDIRVVVNEHRNNAYFYRQNDVDYIMIGRWHYNGANGKSLAETDIVAHEFTHAVAKSTANFNLGTGESAALNESFADIFGEMVERYNNSNNHDWVLGAQGGFQRAFSANIGPSNPQFPQPAQIYKGTGWSFSGQPHQNGGVQNRWFYLLSVGASPSSGLYVPAIGEERAARIAYRNLTRYLGSNATYANARSGAIQAATDLYGACSEEVIATTNAWAALGVGSSTSPYCAAQITGNSLFCVEDGSNVYAEYRLQASPGATKNWSVDNPAFGFSSIGQVDFAVLTQVPTYAAAATLSVYVAYPNPSADVWRYYSLNTQICNPQPPYCPPGQPCEVQVQQRMASTEAAGQEATISPNPADAYMTLDLAVPAVVPTTVSVKDMLGRTLYSQQVMLGQRVVALDVARLPVGTYVVTIATATTMKAKRFQVSH
ncbi:M4 family metallopeptidase [Hymenobacter amundsenii]|nr:M4 family metallopeptidase [Hymenobacter amundsenii]